MNNAQLVAWIEKIKEGCEQVRDDAELKSQVRDLAQLILKDCNCALRGEICESK